MGTERILFQDVDINEVAGTDLTLRLINRDITSGKFLSELGLTMTKPGEPVPDSGGVPRMFIMKDGQIRTFAEENISFGSREFWRTAAQGQIFIYPAGEKHPVQMQLKNPTGFGDVGIRFSQPLDPEKLPDVEMPAPPRKPRWYHRLFNLGSNRTLCRNYDDYVAKQVQLKNSVKSFAQTISQTFGNKRTSDFLGAEKIEKEKAMAAAAEAKEIEDTKKALNQAKAHETLVENRITNALRFYGPTPEKVPGLVLESRNADNRKGLLYTNEEFAKLKTVKIEGLKVGKQQITPREFASLALCAGTDPKIGYAAQKVAKDPSFAVQAMKNDGFTQLEAEEIITESSREMYGRSLMIHRADTGVYIEPAVQPARQKAQEALSAYQSGDKQPMAEIMARAVLCFGNECTTRTTLEDSMLAQNCMVCDALDMMDRDPQLKEMARQKYEQHEKGFNERHPEYRKASAFDEQLTSIRQMQKINTLRQKNLTAKKTLLQAKADGSILSPEEKHRLVKDIIKYETISYRYTADVSLSTSPKPNIWNKDYHALLNHTKTLPKQAGVFGAKSESGTSSAPVTADSLMLGALTPRTIQKPDVLNMLDHPKQMAQLDTAVDNLIQKDGLANTSITHIVNKLAINDSNRDYEYADESLMTKLVMANPHTGRGQQASPQKVQQGREAEDPAGQAKEGQALSQIEL